MLPPQMLDLEGTALDTAVDSVDDGFIDRMVESVALEYRDIDNIMKDWSAGAIRKVRILRNRT